MRKAQKQKILEFINSLHQAHEEIKGALKLKNIVLAQNMISEAQEFAVTLGENIEKLEGEGHVTVSYIEEYCEILFHVFEGIGKKETNENKVYKILRRQLVKIENSVKNDISVRTEMVFLPYKASMWDSLESVYLAAKEDPDCDAYCIPIPYYTLNPDRSFGQMHYEGSEYPENIEVTDYKAYNLEERKPDVIYIHNPYDNCNLVTSVHPKYYSSNLKKCTETLVYIPYYATAGGMAEAQSLLPAYLHADYIVIQSPQFREYFDKSIPDRKFLPFGSPKFDRVINKCKNPSAPPEEWAEKMSGKDGSHRRVIFYNTSINGMLADTENFLKKMEYVFRCFAGREDVCLLWRPHPLLESTFDSMRPQYRPIFDALKRYFIESGLGIYDTTPDIEDTIAHCDAYIGDAGTSVTSLFGVAGKPVFILNNQILEEPGEEDWQGKFPVVFWFDGRDQFAIVQGSKLYVSDFDQYRYRYFCDLPKENHVNNYYILSGNNGKRYACPFNAQHILVIGKSGVERRIELEKAVEGDDIFSFPKKYGKYLLLCPVNYPAVVRYDTVTEEIRYFAKDKAGYIKETSNQKITGGSLVYQGNLYIASPTNNVLYKLDIESGESILIELPIQSRCGGDVLVEYGGEIWLMPYDGQVIVRWNPKTNEVREYGGFPNDFLCKNFADNSACMERPFCTPAFYGNYAYFPPFHANMSLKLNMDTGEFERWIPTFERDEKETQDLNFKGSWMFLDWKLRAHESSFKIYSLFSHKLYSMNCDGTVFQEIEIQFDMEELKNDEPGFCKCSDSLPYACVENNFNTLTHLLSRKTVGQPFSQKEQFMAYKEIAANYDGRCGEKVHDFVKRIEK